MSVELDIFKSELEQARGQFCGSWKKETRALSNMLRYTKKIDEIIKNIWENFEINEACLVAVGGYGRGEFHSTPIQPLSEFSPCLVLDAAEGAPPGRAALRWNHHQQFC